MVDRRRCGVTGTPGFSAFLFDAARRPHVWQRSRCLGTESPTLYRLVTVPVWCPLYADNFRTTIETTCEIQMKKPAASPTEQKCAACNGTGFAVVAQPELPGRKIYPPRCKECEGKGRITGAAN
jgi:hypothetical protein